MAYGGVEMLTGGGVLGLGRSKGIGGGGGLDCRFSRGGGLSLSTGVHSSSASIR